MGKLEAKECAKDIAGLLKDKDAGVRGEAIMALGELDAKEYADDIFLLVSDFEECSIWYNDKRGFVDTTVSEVAEKVLKGWGFEQK